MTIHLTPPATALRKHIERTAPGLAARLDWTRMFKTINLICEEYNLAPAKLTDPIAGTCSRVLAEIRLQEDDGK